MLSIFKFALKPRESFNLTADALFLLACCCDLRSSATSTPRSPTQPPSPRVPARQRLVRRPGTAGSLGTGRMTISGRMMKTTSVTIACKSMRRRRRRFAPVRRPGRTTSVTSACTSWGRRRERFGSVCRSGRFGYGGLGTTGSCAAAAAGERGARRAAVSMNAAVAEPCVVRSWPGLDA